MKSTRLNVAKYTYDDVYITPQHDFSNNALSLGANWSVKDSLQIRFNVSTAYRPPHVSELYSEGLHHGAAAIETGDAALKSERYNLANYNIGYSYYKIENFPEALSAFRKYVKDKMHTDVTRFNDATLRLADCFFIQQPN